MKLYGDQAQVSGHVSRLRPRLEMLFEMLFQRAQGLSGWATLKHATLRFGRGRRSVQQLTEH